MKQTENETFELIPLDGDEGDDWGVRIIEGAFPETVLKMGQVSMDGTDDDPMISFNFTVISSPDSERTSENEDLQILAGDILQEIIRSAVENNTGELITREVQK